MFKKGDLVYCSCFKKVGRVSDINDPDDSFNYPLNVFFGPLRDVDEDVYTIDGRLWHDSEVTLRKLTSLEAFLHGETDVEVDKE